MGSWGRGTFHAATRRFGGVPTHVVARFVNVLVITISSSILCTTVCVLATMILQIGPGAPIAPAPQPVTAADKFGPRLQQVSSPQLPDGRLPVVCRRYSFDAFWVYFPHGVCDI